MDDATATIYLLLLLPFLGWMALGILNEGRK